jgi:hypothetical protein
MTVNNQKRRIKAPLWKEIVFQQAKAHSPAPLMERCSLQVLPFRQQTSSTHSNNEQTEALIS